MIDFLKYRFVTACVSLAILVGSAGMYVYNVKTKGQAFTYSIDFEGGTQALLRFAKPVSGEKLKAVLEHEGWHGAVTREFSSTEILVRVKEFVNEFNNDIKSTIEKCRNKFLNDHIKWFAIIILICDDYCIIKNASEKLTKFVAITAKLPMELQMIICNRVLGRSNNNICGKNVDDVLKELIFTIG